MAIGRLFGDRIVQALGDARVLLYGSLCAAAGFGLVVAAPWAWASLAGFTVVGLGVSNIVPVLFSATARQKFMPLSLAVSACDDHRLPRRACGSGAHGIRRPRHQPCDRLLYYTGADVLRGGSCLGPSLEGREPVFSESKENVRGERFQHTVIM
ncbi:hypothetical protein [Bilophila wadsworthia]|uniref:hypothetical protein n=1 Tax=Bilophila wadsworthia TaxID=35833 RepID=UPI003520EDCD